MGTGLKRQVSTAFDGKSTRYHMFRGSLSGTGQDNAQAIYQPEAGDRDTKPKTHAETFKNNRSQYYSKIAYRFYNTYKCVIRGEYIDPDEMISLDSEGIEDMAMLRSELCRIPLKPVNNGLIQIMSKEDMKRLLKIESPNLADSCMMSIANPNTSMDMAPIQFETWA
jgi:phage terminase large subunit